RGRFRDAPAGNRELARVRFRRTTSVNRTRPAGPVQPSRKSSKRWRLLRPRGRRGCSGPGPEFVEKNTRIGLATAERSTGVRNERCELVVGELQVLRPQLLGQLGPGSARPNDVGGLDDRFRIEQ